MVPGSKQSVEYKKSFWFLCIVVLENPEGNICFTFERVLFDPHTILYNNKIPILLKEVDFSHPDKEVILSRDSLDKSY